MPNVIKKVQKVLVTILCFMCIAIFIDAETSSNIATPNPESVEIGLIEGWRVSYDDSREVLVNLPVTPPNSNVEFAEFYYTFGDEEYFKSNALILAVTGKSVWIDIDGIEIYEQIFSPSFFNSEIQGSGKIIVALPSALAGKTLHIKYQEHSMSYNNEYSVPILTYGSITNEHLTPDEIRLYSVCAAFLFISMLMFMMSFIKIGFNDNNRLFSLPLGLILLTTGTWVLCYADLAQVLTDNWVSINETEHLMYHFIPFSFWLYIEISCGEQSKIPYIMKQIAGFYFGIVIYARFFGVDYAVFSQPFSLLALIHAGCLLYIIFKYFKTSSLSFKLFQLSLVSDIIFILIAVISVIFTSINLNMNDLLFTAMMTGGSFVLLGMFSMMSESLNNRFDSTYQQNLDYEYRRYESLMSNTTDVLFDWYLPDDTAYISSNFEKLFGRPSAHESFRELCITVTSGTDFMLISEEAVHRLLHDESEVECIDSQFTHPNGEKHYFKTTLTASLDRDGSKTHIVGIIKDTTEQKLLESQYLVQLQYNDISKQMYQNIIEANISKNSMTNNNMQSYITQLGLADNSSFTTIIKAIGDNLTHKDQKDAYLENFSIEKLLNDFANNITDSTFISQELNEKGEYCWLRFDTRLYQIDGDDSVYIISHSTDVTKEKEKEDFLIESSKRDTLSSLLNKTAVKDAIVEHLATCDPDIMNAFIMIDVDHFKQINDTLGHAMGDHVITDVATRLSDHFRGTDIIGRFGGDEYIVMMCDTSMNAVVNKCTELNKNFRLKYAANDLECQISLSIGVSIAPFDGNEYNTLSQKADDALYRSKNKGRDCYTIFK